MSLVSQPRNHLDLEALRTFLIAIEEGSFTAAAAILYKTPSAVSYRIKGLEENLGIQLLERTTHSVAPTEAGKRLASKAENLLDLHQRFYDELDVIKTGIEPSFTIVINNLLYDDAAAAKLLKHLCARFETVAFKVQKSVFTGVWDYMIHENGSFAIGAPSFHAIDESFVTTPLGLIDWVLVGSPRHPALRAGKDIDEAAVKALPAVNVEDTSTHSDGRPAWRLAGQEEIIVPNLLTKMHCHAEGLGVGFLPRPIAQPWIEDGRLAELAVEGIVRQPSPMSLVRKKNDDGRVGDYLEHLIGIEHDLIKPFLLPIGIAGDDGRSTR